MIETQKGGRESRTLPIWQIHGQLIETLREGNRLALVAPTGSGKTTQVPQMLLDSGLAGEGKIVVLQPRRVAARTVAARVARERSVQLGAEVGYQIRFDDQTSLGTRISYVTEGILLRWLQADPWLANVNAVLFDEFHERNLLSDVALALAKRLQQQERPDLKIIVMSATLEAEAVAEYLEPCPVIVSEGRSFPVELRYLSHPDERPVTEQAADAVEDIVNAGEAGDILVFMPGMAEINATISAVRAADVSERLALIALHGELPPEQQDLAFAPNSLRKVVVATNVAETSVTIDGIRHVVDGGLARVSRYDAERGINTLLLEPISRASAEQRQGRAGRTAPGTCHRLWTESGQLNRPERNTPEIQRSDLAEVVLLLHSLGVRRAAEFDWLDKPDPQAVKRAERLLELLGALGTAHGEASRSAIATGYPGPGRASLPASQAAQEHRNHGSAGASPCQPEVHGEAGLTPIGRQMLKLPMHPRYSRMLVEAAKYGCVPAAALCAALVSGRDLLTRLGREDKHIKEARELFEASQESDFYTLMRAYQFAKNCDFNVERCRRYGIHAQTARQVEQTFEQILNIAGALRSDAATPSPTPPTASNQPDPLLRCLMTGFIDQLCLRRDHGTLECELTEGRRGTLMRESVVQNAPLFVAAAIREVSGRGSENLTLLGLASAVRREWVEETFPEQIAVKIEHLYDRTHKRVAPVKLVRFRDLVIHHEHQREVEVKAAGRALAEAARKGYFELPLLNHEVKQLIQRVNLVVEVRPELEFPAFDDEAITACLARAFEGLTLAKEAQATPLRDVFRSHLAPEQLGWLDELAPTTIPWPDGRRLKVLYPEGPGNEGAGKSKARVQAPAPELQVKIQECFALKEHPLICEGKVPVTLWLGAPDGKRLEATNNWPAFKVGGYLKLKPALQRKYPGVPWP